MAATKFNVVVDIPLTKTQTAALNKDIQALVKKHIAKVDNTVIGRKIVLPKEWIGIWVKNFNTIDALKNSQTFTRL